MSRHPHDVYLVGFHQVCDVEEEFSYAAINVVSIREVMATTVHGHNLQVCCSSCCSTYSIHGGQGV